jgi:hypothetical protein
MNRYSGKHMSAAQILPIMPASLPTMLAVLMGILINNARLSDLKGDMNSRFGEMNVRINELRADVNTRFDQSDRRFEELKDLWRSELRRVEDILDARLKHLEER